MLLGIAIAFTFTAVMLILFLLDRVNPWTLFIPMPLIYLGESLVYANATSLVLSHAKNKSYASAAMSFLNVGMSVATLFVFESLPSHSVIVMPLVFTSLAAAMILLRGGLSRIMKAEINQ